MVTRGQPFCFSSSEFEDHAGAISTTALSGVYSVDANTGRFEDGA